MLPCFNFLTSAFIRWMIFLKEKLSLLNQSSSYLDKTSSTMGPNHAAVTCSATGAHSIGDATRMIQFGDSDVTVAGSTESSIDALSIAGFFRSRTLTTNTILHH
ncbi:hypothetical protein SLEP1_g56316 [Rubroshorea leprosula]|uniref:beta-ketoacyl-[acyl-carrier-protein] synthase I n=1 Tax=Rubroshorea leprosula TaxID=152421 RepID=A0AAV5MI45_9ROSI|nr:hypothetical protein SLEP1_g56316 [Rubroshorea leprosula]